MNVADVLRFEIAVNAATYRSLVANLRSQSGPQLASPANHSPRRRSSATKTATNSRTIKAMLDLDIASQTYSISALSSSLSHHKLPQKLTIKPGSRTHQNITSTIANSLRPDQSAGLAGLIEKIIEVAPTIDDGYLTVCRDDFELSPIEQFSSKENATDTISVMGVISPTILLDFDEVPSFIVPQRPEDRIQATLERLRNEAALTSHLQAKVTGNTIEISASVRLPEITDIGVELYLHWGSYEDVAPAWQDELVAACHGGPACLHSVSHKVYAPEHGSYGATLFVKPSGSNEIVWLGGMRTDDITFTVTSDDCDLRLQRQSMLSEMQEIATSMLSIAVQHPETLIEQTQAITSYAPHLGVGDLLRQAVSSSNRSNALESLVQKYSGAPQGAATGALLKSYGIGEIVFATPEGSHAAAGGLAQVISGLPPELCKAGIPVTIITPLYTHANGSKHHSAQRILNEGIKIGDKRVRPSYLGSIKIELGPTYYSGTAHQRNAPSAVPIRVFLAQVGKLRVFLLSNAAIFDRLYQPVYADQQLRRVIAFSRAALETIATDYFGIRPSAIISNDWMTACIPTFAALDPKYQSVAWMKRAKTIHMIHNGGSDYHGRLPINFNNEDLWPLFNLSSEHFFGFKDPHNHELINLTMAAANHVTGGILTVSSPYAKQLASSGGGDGLELILQHKSSKVFGISNGINRDEIDHYLSQFAGVSRCDLANLDILLAAKARARAEMQERFGLTKNANARIVSFVGRIAEQKGLSLLTGAYGDTWHSSLEELLIKHADIQVLVAGPVTDGDSNCSFMRHTLNHLKFKYPGRVATHFDYIAHSKALESIFGSTLFLMPSRFEPGGIAQLEALAAGTLVVGRNVGGISATIENYDPSTSVGNGFLCNDYSPTAFANTVNWALEVTQEPSAYRQLVCNARAANHSWSDRVPQYLGMLQQVLLNPDEVEALGRFCLLS